MTDVLTGAHVNVAPRLGAVGGATRDVRRGGGRRDEEQEEQQQQVPGGHGHGHRWTAPKGDLGERNVEVALGRPG
jgi:hypothetical protein